MTYITERRKIHKELDIRHLFDGKTVADVQESLSALLVTNPQNRIDVGTEDDYGFTTAYIHLIYQDWETEEEFARRKASEANSRDWERKNYERLKKKFEG